MDLSDFDVVAASERGTEMELYTPDGKATGLKPHILGYDAEEIVQAGREFDREMSAKPHGLSQDDYNRTKNAFMAGRCVTNWDQLDITIKGEKLNRDSAKRLLANRSFGWIADQIVVTASIRGNFFRGVSKS